jgi:hypothetical protein
MKKLLLLVAAATLMLGATAATPKIATQAKQTSVLKLNQVAKTDVNKEYTATGMLKSQANAGAMRAKAAVTPEGETKPYMFSAYLSSLFGMSYYSGIAVNISKSEDGSKVFFDNMFPMSFNNGETWVQGNVSTDGTSVVIPADVSVAEMDWTDSAGELHTDICYVGELVLSGPDEEGYYTIEGVKEAVYAKDGDTYFVEDDLNNPMRYIALFDYEPDGSIYAWDYMLCPSFEPAPEGLEVVELPEGAEPAEFIYYYNDSWEEPVMEKGLVYVDGDDVYMNDLTPGLDAWVKGTKDKLGTTVTFPQGQFLGIDGYYLFYTPFYVDGEVDEDGYLIVKPGDFELTFDPETGVYSNLDENKYSAYGLIDGSLYDYANSYQVKPYAGDVPAVPSDPYNLEIYDYTASWGQYCLYYDLDPLDVDGNWINPENLSYYLYVDGEQYTLTPEVFKMLEENMDLIPYGFADGWDIGNGYIYVGEPLMTTLGVQAVYTVGEETNYSNVVSVDLEGNVTVVPAPQLNPDGLNNVTAKQITSIAIYDAEGRKLEAAQKGVNVVKMVASDGTVKAVKMYKK